jgi:hypothetical protein
MPQAWVDLVTRPIFSSAINRDNQNVVKEKKEVNFDASFLSQSGRFVMINTNVRSANIANSKGECTVL